MYLKNKNNYIAFRVSDDIYKDITALSDKMHLSRSDLLRFIIESYIIQLRSVSDDNKKTDFNN